MKNILKLIAVSLIVFLNISCNLNSSKNVKTEKESMNENYKADSLINANFEYRKQIKESNVTHWIVGKTYYVVEKKDSDDIIIDYYEEGKEGLRFTKSKVYFYGSEEWRMYFGIATQSMNIDSISVNSDDLQLFLSTYYDDGNGGKAKYTDNYKIYEYRINILKFPSFSYSCH